MEEKTSRQKFILAAGIGTLAILGGVLATFPFRGERPDVSPVENTQKDRPNRRGAVEEKTDENSTATVPSGGDNVVEDTQKNTSWPLYISTMTHLEGEWDLAITKEDFFDAQAQKVRHGLDLAEEYDAILTVESEEPMAKGMVNFHDNLLQEVVDRGHGVGSHCDISAKTLFDAVAIANEFKERKDLVDNLIGADENRGCSGGGGVSDWYVGAKNAGFSYINGIVGFHYLAVPVAERPQGWDDQKILHDFFHYVAPQDTSTYFYPFLISKVGFTEDPQGDLLVSAGSLGNIRSFAEESPWTLLADTHCPKGTCPLTSEDAQGIVSYIADFAEQFDGHRPAKITIYLPTDLFSGSDDAVLRELFSGIQGLVEEKGVVWATQGDVYDGVMEYYRETY